MHGQQWSAQIWQVKKEDYSWLTCSAGFLGCEICKKVGSLSVQKHQGLSISTKWAHGKVIYGGHDHETTLRALGKKIWKHKNTTVHISAAEILRIAEKSTLEGTLVSLLQREIEITIKIMRTAYYIAKNNKPYTDHQDLIELQTINGKWE